MKDRFKWIRNRGGWLGGRKEEMTTMHHTTGTEPCERFCRTLRPFFGWWFLLYERRKRAGAPLSFVFRDSSSSPHLFFYQLAITASVCVCARTWWWLEEQQQPIEGTGNGRKDPRPRSILSPAAQDPIRTKTPTKRREEENRVERKRHGSATQRSQGCRTQFSAENF